MTPRTKLVRGVFCLRDGIDIADGKSYNVGGLEWFGLGEDYGRRKKTRGKHK